MKTVWCSCTALHSLSGDVSWRVAQQLLVVFAGSQTSDKLDGKGDEPEAAVLFVACGIGFSTGLAVVFFNLAIHEIRDLAWQVDSLC